MINQRMHVEPSPRNRGLNPREIVGIDEFQHVPVILDAIKAELNRHRAYNLDDRLYATPIDRLWTRM
jgi:hypothetical protein